MSAPGRRTPVETASAPTPVQRPKGNPIRRHWLTGAFVIGLLGVISMTGLQVYRAEQRLEEARQTQAGVEAELNALRQKNERLQDTLKRVTSDESMELKAKHLGFTKKNERVYQTGKPKTD